MSRKSDQRLIDEATARLNKATAKHIRRTGQTGSVSKAALKQLEAGKTPKRK